MVKNLPANTRDMGLIPGLGRSPGKGDGNLLPLPGKSHGQRSLVGYSPWDHRSWIWQSSGTCMALQEGRERWDKKKKYPVNQHVRSQSATSLSRPVYTLDPEFPTQGELTCFVHCSLPQSSEQ